MEEKCDLLVYIGASVDTTCNLTETLSLRIAVKNVFNLVLASSLATDFAVAPLDASALAKIQLVKNVKQIVIHSRCMLCCSCYLHAASMSLRR